MADDTGDVLRRSLDAVDRHRKRLIVGLAVTVILLLLTFVTGARAARTGNSAVQAFLAHFMMLVIWMTALTLVVVIQMTVMTKRILRAIELAWKK
jgi:heme/copper-type cytochrome/quinol oxidase subunit 2